ncbi:MAG: hydantoinase B/oxoprolinase family protein [Sulfolobales archaeon]
MVSWEIIYRATVFIAEEMGVALKRSAFSPNIRERMDHSCAILDEYGRIVSQAEHIPVHLGSFRIGVINTLKWIEREGLKLDEGDMILTNDPYIAGTHLNDLMVLAPIFYEGRVVGYVVNKAHHVDVGGPMPASLNPYARTIYEEGLIIPPTKILRRGEINREILSFALENIKTPDVFLGDLNAQIAANRTGISRVLQLIDRYGLENVIRGWSSSIEYGEKTSRAELIKWPQGVFEAEDYLEWNDDLVNIRVRLRIEGEGVTADFTGTHKQIEAPLNAVLGVTYAATSFAIRSLMGSEIPVNEGFYRVVRVIAPEGSIVNPVKPAPVGGGNLETSDRIVDVVYLALSKAMPGKIPAASSGTMMNIMLGGFHEGRYWSYYETIGGGSGGRPMEDGVSGVHVYMTNTLNTPIETAEREYPIIFTRYMIREGSGGRGRFRGGDGIVRSFKVLAPARFSVLADRFRIGPWGLEGGERGSPGSVRIITRGSVITLKSKASAELAPGDEVIIETPGGGGYGLSVQ